MKNLWNNAEASALQGDLLKLRVYTSRLQGQEPDLVLHGGGNTSVKITEQTLFGEEELLYVKGSGWDLATIEAAGFAPVRLRTLMQMAEFEHLSDSDMVKYQRAAMTNPFAPNPSVEAILHAIIPFTFVDHTHADAVVTITNSPGGEERIREIYGDRVLIIPYVMPGFILAKAIYEQTQGIDWSAYEGMILLNHGIFTFHDDAKESYDKMVELVSLAEDYLKQKGAVINDPQAQGKVDPQVLARIRKAVSQTRGRAVLAMPDNSAGSLAYANLPGVEEFGTRGPVTPDHVIRTKAIPVVIGEHPEADVEAFEQAYRGYFAAYNDGSQQMLDPAPRFAIWPGHGMLTFGTSPKENYIIRDIMQHTTKVVRQAEHLGEWQALPYKDLFEMEYWELEQAKLKKGGSSPAMQGKVALVTGAANGIGKACVERLLAEGAVVAALDINPAVQEQFASSSVLGMACDASDETALRQAVEACVSHFGGLDLLVSNVGVFPPSTRLSEMQPELWDRTLNLNLSSHQRLLTICLPYLELGVDPAVVIIGSKNVPAPGPGQAAYSVAKAGLTQLARVAALEFGAKGIRVNVLHPNAVYDTGIWTETSLKQRADHYGLTVEAYKTNNVLGVEVTSHDVAALVTAMLGPLFGKTTGAQLPIDGGNDRVI